MKSALKIVLFGFFCVSLSFCSSAPKEETTGYESYQSSGIYDDIQGEASNSERATSSQNYTDDDYGDVDSAGDEELYLGGTEEEEPMSNDDTLPVEKLQTPEPAPTEQTASAPEFKNGMYHMAVNCTMRAEPSTSGAKEGVVPKGKKLWVEKYNRNWVKVFKKSGPVFINKVCL